MRDRVSGMARGGLLARRLPLLMLVAMSALAVGSFIVARRTVNDQSRRILGERTSEVALLLQNALGQLPSTVRSLGVAARLGDPSPGAFLDEARAERALGTIQSAALVRRVGDRLTVVAALGGGPAQGSTISGQRAAAVQRALAAPQLTVTQVFRLGPRRAIGFALGPPVTAPGSAIYLESPIDPVASPVTRSQPFNELDAVLYATPRALPDQVVITTAPDFPLHGGRVASQRIPVGGASWLLTTKARHPLVGSFANAVPWLLLGVGLLVALIASAIVQTLRRRRDYALALVDERTAALSTSLGQLEDAQSRLVLQERLAAIGQVAAAVGHELRNPLGVLTNALYLIRIAAPNGDEPPISRHLATAEREVSAAAAIVDSLLDFAREREPVTQPVDLDELVEESLTVAQPPPLVEVRRSGLEELPPVLADRLQLRQVLLNLLTNAYEAMDERGGVLTIAARGGERDVEIRVSDDGAGMDDETASRVFEPFFTRKAKGIGLGLPVTKRIVEKHGGTIAAESLLGSGTTFVLTLPSAAVLDEVG